MWFTKDPRRCNCYHMISDRVVVPFITGRSPFFGGLDPESAHEWTVFFLKYGFGSKEKINKIEDFSNLVLNPSAKHISENKFGALFDGKTSCLLGIAAGFDKQ